ncbi:MAG: hypothetical protein WBD55_03360 [Dehalococcoidia bacterium]
MEATETLTRESNGLLARSRGLIDKAIDLEFTKPATFAALAVVYIVSRVPWLNMGYGTDPDAWRVALTARYLWDHGDYYPSRLPGYPLHEFVTALFIKGGWIATNLSTVLISLVGIYLFASLAKKLDLENRGALTIAFAFAPLLWINSVMTMDYMWTLTFIMGAYLALLHRQPQLAGIVLGVATGFRIASLGMLVPFGLLLWRTDQRKDIRPFAVTALATAFVAYTPVLMRYGFDFLNFYDQSVPLAEVIKRVGKDGLGIVGALAVLGALGLSWQRIRHLPGDMIRDPHVLTWVAVVVVFMLSYTQLPHEIAYLIPLFPFGFFLLSRYLTRGMLAAVLAVIVLAGFVDITSPDDTFGITAETFTSARIGKGMLLSDVETLRNQRDFADELHDVATKPGKLQRPAVVITGFIYPELVMLYYDDLKVGILEDDHEAISQLSDKGRADLLDRDGLPTITYAWLLEYDAFQRFESEGAHIYYTADAARSSFAVNGFRPGYFGAMKLKLSRENPSLGQGTTSTNR